MRDELKKTFSEYIADCQKQSIEIAKDKSDARQDVYPSFEGFMQWLGVKDAPEIPLLDPVANALPQYPVYDDEEFWHGGKQVTAKEYTKITGIQVLPASERPGPDTSEDDTTAKE